MKKAKKWILLAVIAAVVVGVFVYLWQQSRPKPVKYETPVVTLGTIQKSTIVTGKIEPRDEVEIKPQISGIITELYKQAGDKVRVGDAIAKIKVIPDMAQLNSAESRVRLAKYNLENSRKVFERDSVLLAQNVIANEAYEKSRLQYISDQEEYLAAEDHLSITRDGVALIRNREGDTIHIVSVITGTFHRRGEDHIEICIHGHIREAELILNLHRSSVILGIHVHRFHVDEDVIF
mgnify:CR=1 FL=1